MHVPLIQIPKLFHAKGSITLPGSKSISNRVLLLSALAQGATRLYGLLDSDDTQVMLSALRKLGVTLHDNKNIELSLDVEGCNGVFPEKEADLFMGNAGTAIRPLTAALSVMSGIYHLHGVPRMHERPIRDLVDGLTTIGAQIDYLGQQGYPPLQIKPGQILTNKPVQVRGDVSSQFLTALLMALPLTQHSNPIEVQVKGELISKPYIEITLRLMEKFGIKVENEGWQRFIIPAHEKKQAPVYVSPGEFWVEGDASSASYFLAAGALGGGPLKIHGVGRESIQGDVAFAQALSMMGANISQGQNWIEVRGIDTEDFRLKAIELDCTAIPDAAMTLAVLALFADGPSTLTGIASWKVKETDRIAAMTTELKKLGAQVIAGDDYIKVTPPATWLHPKGGIDTYDDHRMAMCFSLAAFGPLPIQINHPECVTKTYPNYFDDFLGIVS